MNPNFKLHSVITFLLLFNVSSLFATEKKPTIHWLNPGWPPMWINSGVYKGQGLFDITNKQVEELFPEYNFSVIENVVYQRMASMFHNTDETYCNAATVPGALPDLDKVAIFSDEVSIFPAISLIVKKDNKKVIDLFQKKGSNLSLVDLVTNHKDLKMSCDSGWAGLIPEDIRKEKHVFVASGGADSHLKMLFTGRVEYTLEYSLTTAYFLKIENSNDEFESFPIKEVKHPLSFGISCNKTKLAKEFLDKYNEKLPDIRLTDVFMNALMSWQHPKGKEEFKKLYLQRYSDKKKYPIGSKDGTEN